MGSKVKSVHGVGEDGVEDRGRFPALGATVSDQRVRTNDEAGVVDGASA
jgi:hypothetical protein